MAVREQEGEGGDGYFASVSDLMVGILFVFLLMMTVYALNYRKAEQNQEVSRKELETAQKKRTVSAICWRTPSDSCGVILKRVLVHATVY